MGLSRILAVSLVASLVTFDANAAEPKPDYQLKTKTLDISVILAPAIKSNAALAADSLKEGKAWAAKQRVDAKSAMKEVPALVSADRPWTYERKYNVGSTVAGRYISIVRSDYMDTNAAHPNSNVDTVLWDKRLGLVDLLRRSSQWRVSFEDKHWAVLEKGAPTVPTASGES